MAGLGKRVGVCMPVHSPTRPIRLVLLGNPRLKRSWKNCLAHAARQLGWQTTVLQDNAVSIADVVRACDGADLLIWARSHGHQPSGDIARMWRKVAAGGTATASVHLDLYWGLPHREPEIGRHPWWHAQHVFTADGGRRDWSRRGVNHHWLPPPAADRWTGPGTPRPHLACDVVFVGTCGRAHRGSGRDRLLSWAQNRYGNRFRWLGYNRESAVWGRDLADLYASAHIVLGDSVPAARYWSDRVPNALGMGGVLVHPAVDGLADVHGDTVVTYRRGDFAILGDIIDGLLADPDRRRRLREGGVRQVAERHLWRHRLVDIAHTCGVL